MVDRVFVHIGLPKTATSYLQTIIWSNRERLRARGVVVPGSERRDHLWASRTVREQRHPAAGAGPPPHRVGAHPRRARDAEGTGLISHEFFAAASADQAGAMVEALAPAEVHLVVTAREPLGLFTASWQESLKNGSTTPMPDYAPPRVAAGRRTSGTGAPSTCGWCSSAGRRRFRPSGSMSLVARPGGPAGGRLAAVRGDRRLPDRGDRPVRVVPQHLDGRRRGRDPAPGQRPAERLRAAPSTGASTSARFLADERLVPARRGPVLARARPGRGMPPPGRGGHRLPPAARRSTSSATSSTSGCRRCSSRGGAPFR